MKIRCYFCLEVLIFKPISAGYEHVSYSVSSSYDLTMCPTVTIFCSDKFIALGSIGIPEYIEIARTTEPLLQALEPLYKREAALTSRNKDIMIFNKGNR